jgi:phosphoribosylanthranilate isomerase
VVKIKICGITNLQDALSCVNAGSDALGFVFYKKSSRYIPPEQASLIIRRIPKRVIKVGVFVDEKEEKIRKTAQSCSLDILQFHGSEKPEFCQRFKDWKVIKAFRVKGCVDKRRIAKYNTFAYLFDTFTKAEAGGTGKVFNWRSLSHLDTWGRPIFLSGGLTAENVLRAIRCVSPSWVDVSSSVERSAGRKDIKKVKKFIKEAKRG